MVLLLVIGVLLPALSASASKQALVHLAYKNKFALVIAGTTTFTYSGPFTPFGFVSDMFGFVAGTIAKSHANAAPPGGSTLMGVSAATTKCFASTATAMPGPPALPNQCFPRRGTGMRMPGTKKYGGTARILRNGVLAGTIVATTGFDQISQRVFRTPALEGPSAVGNYGIHGSGTQTNTVTGIPKKSMAFDTSNPFTTGQITVKGGDFGTAITISGTHALNTANLTGTISLVQPVLRNIFGRDGAGNFTGNEVMAGVGREVTITFIPEPGVTLALACGILGLGALAALRKR
jgi:hypothetical protein